MTNHVRQTPEREQGRQTLTSQGFSPRRQGDESLRHEDAAGAESQGDGGRPPLPHWSPPCKLLLERHQSTTYKPCGIQCNVSLFFSPKRGLRLAFRNLGRLSHRYSWKPSQLPSFWQAQKPRHNGTSNTAMADWPLTQKTEPLTWKTEPLTTTEIPEDTVLQKVGGSSWGIQIDTEGTLGVREGSGDWKGRHPGEV